MGYIAHNAIIVTSYDDKTIEQAAQEAVELRMQIVGPSAATLNGYRSLMVCPDGSKEGWESSELGDAQRERFREWLRGRAYVEWVEVEYGVDPHGAHVVHSRWAEEKSEAAEGHEESMVVQGPVDWSKPIELMDGTPARITILDERVVFTCKHFELSCEKDGCIGGVQVVRNRKEPEKHQLDVWINVRVVDGKPLLTEFYSRLEADGALSAKGRIACLHIVKEFVEGEGI